MIKITKPLLQKALIAGFFSAFTIGVLTVLTYKSTLGYFIAASFGSSMVLLFGFPESPFAQPKNVFFGHLVTALVGVIFVNYIPLPIYISIAIAVGAGVFLMILFNIVHPPAGGNPIIVIIGSASYDYLINPIIFGCIIILLLAIIINKYLLKKTIHLNNLMNSEYKVLKYSSNKFENIDDLISIEEPLEISLKYKESDKWINQSLSITMRTPGDDENLVKGFFI